VENTHARRSAMKVPANHAKRYHQDANIVHVEGKKLRLFSEKKERNAPIKFQFAKASVRSSFPVPDINVQ
jgi:hypothetical protein